MWNDAVGWVIGFLGLAVSANWVTSRSDRSLRRIKAEAEVVNLLPDSAARRRLLDHIEQQLTVYIEGPDDYRNFWNYPPLPLITVLQILTSGVVALAFAVNDGKPGQGADFWLLNLGVGSMFLVSLWGTGSRLYSIRARRAEMARLQEVHDQREADAN